MDDGERMVAEAFDDDAIKAKDDEAGKQMHELSGQQGNAGDEG